MINNSNSKDKLDLTKYGGVLVHDPKNQSSNNQKSIFEGLNGRPVQAEVVVTKSWSEGIHQFNELVFVTAVPCLTIFFVVFMYILLKFFYNFAKLFEAKTKKKISELQVNEIVKSEENHLE